MCGETRDFSLAAFFGVREAAEAVSRSAPPPSPRRRIVQRCKDTCHAFPPALQRQFTQRIQDHHRPRGTGAALRTAPRSHRPWRATPPGIPAPESTWPDTGAGRPGRRHHPVRVGGDPAVPGGDQRAVASRRPPGTLGGPDLADFPCFQHGAHPRPARAFRDIRRRAVPAGHRTLSAALRGGFRHPRPAPGRTAWLAGEQYSIADIATFGWTHTARIVDFDFSHYRHLDDWHRRMALRPAVQRGILLPEPAVGP